jgi:hypothetical protein
MYATDEVHPFIYRSIYMHSVINVHAYVCILITECMHFDFWIHVFWLMNGWSLLTESMYFNYWMHNPWLLIACTCILITECRYFDYWMHEHWLLNAYIYYDIWMDVLRPLHTCTSITSYIYSEHWIHILRLLKQVPVIKIHGFSKQGSSIH